MSRPKKILRSINNEKYKKLKINLFPKSGLNHIFVAEGVELPHFRFCQKSHVEKFFDDGELRIGTIIHYRDTIHCDGIRDENEGSIHLDPSSPLSKMEGLTCQVFIPVINSFTLCVSRSFSAEISNRLGYNSCIKIKNYGFYKEITKSIHDLYPSICVINNIYYTNEYDFSKFIHNNNLTDGGDQGDFPPVAFCKNDEYFWQDECRAVWEPINSHKDVIQIDSQHFNIDNFKFINQYLEPIFIKSPDARKFASPIYVI